ncbi:MAG TPA: hypothetical protein VMF66_17925 [Candidatus Acidoferrum sp.]|nr:hypothetical protein [Candidatus Acidoferrum sp.]
MALSVLLIVGVVVAQTWIDWREAHKQAAIPEWAKGAAVASVLAVSLALATSYASAWIDGTVHFASDSVSRVFWPEAGFLLSVLGLGIAAARKKRFRWMLIASAVLVGAIWVGFMISV